MISMKKIEGPHHVVYRGDDKPVAIGRTGNGSPVAVWKQAEFENHEGYAMEESVYNEMMSKHPRRLFLVDQTTKDVFEVPIENIKHPKKFIAPDEETRDDLSEVTAHGGLVRAASHIVVDENADTDDIQRVVPTEVLEPASLGHLKPQVGIFRQVFSDYR